MQRIERVGGVAHELRNLQDIAGDGTGGQIVAGLPISVAIAAASGSSQRIQSLRE